MVVDELKLVIACLNSTMRESHRDADHYGWLGEAQLAWSKQELEYYKKQSWFRLALMHHNPVRVCRLIATFLAKDLDKNRV